MLAGPGVMDVYDPFPATLRDLGSNFYLREEHIGKVSRAEACLSNLKELNPYVIKSSLSFSHYTTFISNFIPQLSLFLIRTNYTVLFCFFSQRMGILGDNCNLGESECCEQSGERNIIKLRCDLRH